MAAGRRISVGLALATLVAAGCRSADPSLYLPKSGDKRAEIVVLDNHWHTALIFRSADLPDAFRSQLAALGARRYVAIGWGDEGFFRAERITPGLVAQALLYSRGSVMLVFGFDKEPEAYFEADIDIYRVPTGRAGLDRTIEAALSSFGHRGVQIIDAGPGIDQGRFFAANGRYAFYHTCNQWTADCLAEGGLPITAAYAVTAGNVALQMRQLSGVLINGRPRPPFKPHPPLPSRTPSPVAGPYGGHRPPDAVTPS